jgi:hypothetical protein
MIHRIKCEDPFFETKGSDNSQHSVVEMTMQETSVSSRAIVPVASPKAEALAIVPVCKSKQPAMGQRRIRRPFSLPEVEALVEAVEQLGTGRFVPKLFLCWPKLIAANMFSCVGLLVCFVQVERR